MNTTDPDRHLCAFEFMGRRCCFPGVVTDSTTGGGRWFCMGHFRAHDQIRRMEVFHASFHQAPPPAAMPPPPYDGLTVEQARAQCMALLRQMVNKPPSKAWAYRLQAKHNAGEPLLPVQLELMNRALNATDEPASIPGTTHEPFS